MGDHGIPETPHQAQPQDSRALLDRRLAYLLLRLTLGINILLHGAVRLPALGAFAEGMVQQFTDTPLLAVAVRLFGLVLPYRLCAGPRRRIGDRQRAHRGARRGSSEDHPPASA